jgi:hypothetical protein
MINPNSLGSAGGTVCASKVCPVPARTTNSQPTSQHGSELDIHAPRAMRSTIAHHRVSRFMV